MADQGVVRGSSHKEWMLVVTDGWTDGRTERGGIAGRLKNKYDFLPHGVTRSTFNSSEVVEVMILFTSIGWADTDDGFVALSTDKLMYRITDCALRPQDKEEMLEYRFLAYK